MQQSLPALTQGLQFSPLGPDISF